MGIKQHRCLVCQRIKKIKVGKNPFFIAELQTGYVVLADNQFYKGYVIFLCKRHVSELHFLDSEFALTYLKEMMLVAKTVWLAFKPRKLNYELLGNSEPHLHWHIIPRYENDPKKESPIWNYNSKIRNAEKYKPDLILLESLKIRLASRLRTVKND